MVNPNHITPYGEISEVERELADDLVFNRRDDALEIFIQHFESKGPEAEAEAADPTAGMEPEEALHWHILRRKRDGVEAQIDASRREDRRRPDAQRRAAAGHEGGRRQVRRRRADPALRAPERRGHEARRRAARAVPRQARGLHQGHRRAGDRVRRRARHRQVAGQHDPDQQRLHGRRPRQAGADLRRSSTPPRSTTRPRSACPRCSCPPPSRCRWPIQELHSQGLEFPVLLGGAAINRKFALRAALPGGQGVRRPVRPGRLLLQGRLRGPGRDGPPDRARAPRRARRGGPRGRRRACARSARRRRSSTRPTTPCARAVRTDVEVPEPPFWGVREIEVDRDELYTHLDTHVLFKLHWGGRGVKGEEWRKLLEEDFRPRLERMWAEADYLHPRALLGYFPCYSEGNDIVVLDPEDRETVLDALHLPAPAQGRPPLPGRLLPAEGLRRAGRRRAADRHRRLRGHRADGQARGRRASSPSSSSSTASACRPPRAWPSGCTGACATTSASTSARAAATRGATRPCRTSPSTSRSRSCWTSRRSAWRSPTATRRSRSSRRSR